MPSTTTTTISPAQLAALLRTLNLDLAQASAIGDFVQAKMTAAAAAAGRPVPAQGTVDPAMVRAAAGQLEAGAREEAARHDFDAARHQLGELAIALYVHQVSTPEVAAAQAGGGLGVDPSVVLGLLLGQVRSRYAAAGRALDTATGEVARARSSADQLVATEAAALAGQAARAAASAPATTWPAAAGPATGPAAAGPATWPAAAGPATSGPGGHATTTTRAPHPAVAARYPSPPILGAAALTSSELAAWYLEGGHQPQLTVPVAALAGYYQSSGASLGVRDDIAFAQAVLETDYFRFPTGGQVAPADNNFAGLGACDTCTHGWHFADARTGVAAQLQLLHAFASTQPVPGPLTGLVQGTGCCQTWMALTGVWATAADYGYNILSVYRQMLEWALPRRQSAAGL
jgi:hypothetical protein